MLLLDYDEIPLFDLRKDEIKKVLSRISGVASANTYENLIKLAFYERNCAINNIPYMDDIKKVWQTLGKTRSASVILKRARRFYFFASNCKNGSAWKICTVAPTYWEDISKKIWEQMINELNLMTSWETYMNSINTNLDL